MQDVPVLLTVFSTSSLYTRSVQLILTILLQQHISEPSRGFWSILWSFSIIKNYAPNVAFTLKAKFLVKRISFLLNLLLMWKSSISFHVYLVYTSLVIGLPKWLNYSTFSSCLWSVLVCTGDGCIRVLSTVVPPTPTPGRYSIPQRLDTPRAISKLCSVVLIHALCRLAVILLCTVFRPACSVLPQGGLRYA